MHFADLMKTMFRNFFVITTGITASMYIFCLIFTPDVVFSLEDIGRILLMAVAGDLPFIIFYSRKEPDKKQMRIRFAIHIPVLLAILLYFAHLWDWVSITDPVEVTVLILLIMVVYATVLATGAYLDMKTAEKLNESLKKRYHS